MPLIHLNGRDYELVSVDQLTLDEALVVWEYTKMGLDELADLEGFHPGVIAALLHVSLARGEPGEPARAIRQAVGQIRVADLEQVFLDNSVEVDELPPPPGPSSSSPNGDSGAASAPPSAPPPAASPPPSTGSPGSATGATSGRETWPA